MKEHRIDQLQNSIKGSKNKLSKPKTRGFGYQVLGFGAGGAGRQIDVPISFLILAGGGGGAEQLPWVQKAEVAEQEDLEIHILVHLLAALQQL